MKNRLKDSDFKLFQQIVVSNQKVLKRTMAKFLRKKYKTVVETDKYVYAEGDVPIALVAHLDTVFDKAPTEIYYDREKNVIWSPQGLGADDRAGVFAIIKIIGAGLRPHIIFTTDEEIGGFGAQSISKLECPFKDLRYIIQLDRRGFMDCVFYECDNKDFTKYVEDFGFQEAYGSFSDISFICPEWEIAGVNLSIGYKDEHTYSERLFVTPMLATIEKVKVMLQEEEIPFFKFMYDEYTQRFYARYGLSYAYDFDMIVCNGCKKEFFEEEVFPVKDEEGKTIYMCPDCIATEVNWCPSCEEAFKTKDKEVVFCPDCRGKYFGNEK